MVIIFLLFTLSVNWSLNRDNFSLIKSNCLGFLELDERHSHIRNFPFWLFLLLIPTITPPTQVTIVTSYLSYYFLNPSYPLNHMYYSNISSLNTWFLPPTNGNKLCKVSLPFSQTDFSKIWELRHFLCVSFFVWI